MEFCPRCGALLIPQKQGGNKTALLCPKCGFRKEVSSSNNKYTLSYDTKHTRKDRTLVIESEEEVKTLPKVKGVVTCPKCGNDEAYYWFLQTRRGDEPPTRFYRCVKCNHVWREYE